MSENTEDADLAYTRGIRRQLVEKIAPKGIMPEDPKAQSILLQTLDGIERVALTKLRIKSDEGINSQKQLAAETLARLFMDPNLRVTHGAIEGATRVLSHDLPADLPPPVLVDGEMEPLGNGDTYDTFQARLSTIQSDDLTA